MKNFTFLILVFCFSNAYSQNSCIQLTKKEIIEKVKGYNSHELIPYQDTINGGFGLMHIKTQKKITKGLFMEPEFFSPTLKATINKPKGYCEIQISGSSQGYQIINNNDYADDTIWEAQNEGIKPKKKSINEYINNDVKGFEVGERKRITYFNSKFYDPNKEQRTLLYSALHLNGRYYAINRISDKHYQIIDQ